ncbi:14662_t:CDS:10 [Funneliformis caledonium]|uniref:DNA mismatch repair protein MSH6 n=1 Tax=Funneliformis caledonium TaxID=1117310 RepID=A0A9N9BBW8_9GLOM|nr:14662_t:CDS:10 [Funneliformis caledonium]
MTLTETTQSLLEKEDDLSFQEIIAASQTFVSQPQQPQPPTPTTNTSGFNLNPETSVPDRHLRARKPKNKTSSDNFIFADASDMSLLNGSTPSLASIANIHSNNATNSNSQNRSINSSKNDRKQHRERSDNQDIPTGPPEMMRDPTTESFSTHAYSWPIAFAVVPPMGALIYGKSDVWSDFLLLLLIAFYLYNIIKVPWELYYAARSRRVVNENLTDQADDPAQEELRNKASKELRRQELWALLLVIVSPIIGGYALHCAKLYLTDYDKYISHFNIILFVFAAGIRPLMHITSLAKNRTLYLQEQVHYPSTEVELLKRRVQHLEYEFSQLRRGFATKKDVINVRDGFEPTLSQLNKAVRRYEKKEQFLRNYSEERFAYLESKLREYDSFISYKIQEEQATTISRSMTQIILLPFNIAKYFVPRSLRKQKPMKDNKGQLRSTSASLIKNKKPAAAQSNLLSFLKKELPTPADSSSKRKVSEEPELPLTPVTPSSRREKTVQKFDNESINDIETTSTAEEIGESTSEVRVLRRRVKRKIYVSSGDDDSDDVLDLVDSPIPEKPRVQKKTSPRQRKAKNDDDDYEQGSDDSVMNDTNDVALVASDDEDNSTRVINKFSQRDQNGKSASKLKAFASNSSVRRGPSFSSSTHMTNTEKKKQRAADFKVKNDERYSWLQDVRDIDGNPEGSPNYDPRTLYIPKSSWDKFTPFEKQFWEIKSNHWDTVVFFKKGKFYELYERDADIGHTEFDLKLTDRVNMRMVGVPEFSFEHWAAQFIAKGHKVARVDQMETALSKEMREKATKKKEEKVIRRQLTSILTAGTLVDGGLLTNEMSTYCMSIKESCPTENDPPAYGICFVDTATGEFNLASFVDDIDRTQFETLIMQVKPKEIVYEKGMLNKRSQRILKTCINCPIWTGLIPEREFWDANATWDEIRFSRYFSNKQNLTEKDDDDDETMEDGDNGYDPEIWPEAIKAARNKPLMMSALGGLIWYLRSLKLDEELVSLRNFKLYDPIRHSASLILDGQTLANLEIFENNLDGSDQGTVFKLLNHCVTPFGKRTFKQWLCHPLRNVEDINERLNAIEELNKHSDFRELFDETFMHFPDLERLISRIHAGTCRVKDFLLVLSAFEKLMAVVTKLGVYAKKFYSDKLLGLFRNVPDLSSILLYFKEAFDHDQAEKEGKLIPYHGIEQDYDTIQQKLSAVEKLLDDHLKETRKLLKSDKIIYKDIGKEIYQLEVPNNIKVPHDWKKLSRTQKVNRYWNSTLQKLVRDLQEALETKSNTLKTLQGRFYEKFDVHYQEWLSAIRIIAEIDCLLSLSTSSKALGEPSCRPQFVQDGPNVLEFEELRHPCVTAGVATDFIPNDTSLGGNEPNIILLTGPNMGGKSTLLRQNCVAIIMAQLGCYVPAKRCRMTPFDRIYTRIGANDNILAGQSTFMVELSETSKILHEATPRSMVILDELGRGTSTFDGYAIAYSVLHYLATYIGCLGLFSTHYGMLTQEFAKNPNIALKHMSCQVDQHKKEVTFLYKLVAGVCPKSYGMNVASMAGVPRGIVDRAEVVAAKFEQTSHLYDTLTANGSNIAITAQCDFAYLLKSAFKKIGSSEDDVGDRALDNQTEHEKEARQTRVLKAIIRSIREM